MYEHNICSSSKSKCRSRIVENDQYLKRFETTNQFMCFYQIGFLKLGFL